MNLSDGWPNLAKTTYTHRPRNYTRVYVQSYVSIFNRPGKSIQDGAHLDPRLAYSEYEKVYIHSTIMYRSMC